MRQKNAELMKQNEPIFKTMSKNDIAKFLYDLNREKYLVTNMVNKFRTSRQFSVIFNKECVESEYNYTIALVLQKIEEYSRPLKNPYNKKQDSELFNAYVMGFKTELSNPYCSDSHEQKNEAFEMGREHRLISQKNIRLDSIEGITGYFIGSFDKNIKKIYQKHKRQKRTASDIISLDGVFSKESESFGNSSNLSLRKKIISKLKSVPEEKMVYKKMIFEMVIHLRNTDRRINRANADKKNKSKLARLFCSIVNEKKNMTSDQLKKEFSWSNFLLNKQKSILMNELRNNFSSYQQMIVEYFDNRENHIG